jgi:hypothetical protein
METWNVTELRKYARRLGVAVAGRKSDLIDRIVAAELSKCNHAAY